MLSRMAAPSRAPTATAPGLMEHLESTQLELLNDEFLFEILKSNAHFSVQKPPYEFSYACIPDSQGQVTIQQYILLQGGYSNEYVT